MSAQTTSGAPAASAATPFTRTDPASIARGLFPHQVEGVAFLLRRRPGDPRRRHEAREDVPVDDGLVEDEGRGFRGKSGDSPHS